MRGRGLNRYVSICCTNRVFIVAAVALLPHFGRHVATPAIGPDPVGTCNSGRQFPGIVLLRIAAFELHFRAVPIV